MYAFVYIRKHKTQFQKYLCVAIVAPTLATWERGGCVGGTQEARGGKFNKKG